MSIFLSSRIPSKKLSHAFFPFLSIQIDHMAADDAHIDFSHQFFYRFPRTDAASRCYGQVGQGPDAIQKYDAPIVDKSQASNPPKIMRFLTGEYV